jgi:integrase
MRSKGSGSIKERSPGRWAIILDINADGKRRRKWHSFRGTRREAQAECTRLINQMNEGTYVEGSKLTLGEFLLERLAQWEAGKKISNKTAERYRELITNQIIPHIGDRRLQKLKAIEIENWHNALVAGGRKDGKGGVSNRTIGHAHRVLSKALKEAARFDLVVKNVAATEKPPKVGGDEEIQIIGEQRLGELLAKLRGRAIYPKAITSLFAGLRRGELLALRWRHIDLDRKLLQVREALEETKAHGIQVKVPKSKAGRRDIKLPEIVVEVLRDHRKAQLELRVRLGLGKLADDDLLFPTLDGSLPSPRAFSAEWADVAASIGMPDITFHALRHTHASQLIAAGIDVVRISKRLGHSNPTVTLRVYAHLYHENDEKAAEAINEALTRLGYSA